MRIVLDLTPQEYRAAHDAIAYLLRPKAVREDPDSANLRSFFDKFAEDRPLALCGECGRRIIYAKGKCKRCWRRERSA